MKINNDNYETYFLLFVDNELSAEERKMVENFVAQNPAFKEELDRLQQTVLPLNEPIGFNKTSLFKPAGAGMLEEKMLLLLDQELSAMEADDFQNKIQADKTLQAEWNLLQKTKLGAADVIPFPGKNILYKKEPASVVSFSFIKWAVAAAVIAGGIFWGLNLEDNIPANTNNTALNAEEVQGKNGDSGFSKSPATIAQTKTDLTNETTVPGNNKSNVGESNQLAKNIANEKQNLKITKNEQAETNVVESTKKNQQVLSNEVAKEIKSIRKPEINTLNVRKTISDKPELLVAMSTKEKPDNPESPTGPNAATVKNNYASLASLNETPDDDHIFLIDEDRLAESKAGAFFKKIKRTVTRTTNISAGKTLKIAGLEFAVK